MTNPPEGSPAPAPFDPFRYGRPEPGSPAAAAYPHLFPAADPSAPQFGPGWTPNGAPPANPGQGAYPGQASYPGQGLYPGPGAYPGQGPNSGYGYAPAPTAAASNGKAVAGFVLGLVSLFLFWLTFLDLPLIVLGVVFSKIGLSAARNGAGQRTLAIWGLVLSLVAASVIVVVVAVVGSRMGGCGDKYNSGSDQYNKCLVFMD